MSVLEGVLEYLQGAALREQGFLGGSDADSAFDLEDADMEDLEDFSVEDLSDLNLDDDDI